MDRKMVCGILLVIIGLVFTSVSIIYVALSENITYSDNGRQIFGIFGSLLATHMLCPANYFPSYSDFRTTYMFFVGI